MKRSLELVSLQRLYYHSFKLRELHHSKPQRCRLYPSRRHPFGFSIYPLSLSNPHSKVHGLKNFSCNSIRMKSTLCNAESGEGYVVKFEKASFAQKADSAVLASVGSTTLLASCVVLHGSPQKPGFLPLSVDFRERASAAGLLPKDKRDRRDARYLDSNILAARAIDRSLRPLFPKGFFNEVQIVITVLSFDAATDLVSLAINAASAALSISSIPWNGPVAAVRYEAPELHQNDLSPQLEGKPGMESDLDLLLVSKGTDRIVMLECGANEIHHTDVLKAVTASEARALEILRIQNEFISTNQKESANFDLILPTANIIKTAFEETYNIAYEMCLVPNITKEQRRIAQTEFWDRATKLMNVHFGNQIDSFILASAIHMVLETALSDLALGRKFQKWDSNTNNPVWIDGQVSRPDGRSVHEIRRIDCEAGVLPVVHGSGLFTRGNTQVLVSATLGSPNDNFEPKTDMTAQVEPKKTVLHYDFPSYSVNRTGKNFINRRCVGHGNLAEKAILPVVPHDLDFFLRLTSEVTGSDGSSSMASICGATLALLDAGIAVKRTVSGISIGLYADDGNDDIFETVTDLLGMEDHFGKMDFKVASTVKGITAMQLDIKREYITKNMIASALEKAVVANSEIIEIMKKVVAGVNTTNSRVPYMIKAPISPHQRFQILGRRWENAKSIEKKSRSRIHIEDNEVIIVGPTKECAEEALVLVRRSMKS